MSSPRGGGTSHRAEAQPLWARRLGASRGARLGRASGEERESPSLPRAGGYDVGMQRFSKRGRTVSSGAGVGFLAVLVLAAVFHVEIETWYHFERLKRDQAYFLEIACEPEGCPKWLACERFLVREEGKLALLRELAAHLKSFAGRKGWKACSIDLDSLRSTAIVSTPEEGMVYGTDIHEVFGKRPSSIVRWLPVLGRGDYILPEDPQTVYGLSNAYEGRIEVYVRS